MCHKLPSVQKDLCGASRLEPRLLLSLAQADRAAAGLQLRRMAYPRRFRVRHRFARQRLQLH